MKYLLALCVLSLLTPAFSLAQNPLTIELNRKYISVTPEVYQQSIRPGDLLVASGASFQPQLGSRTTAMLRMQIGIKADAYPTVLTHDVMKTQTYHNFFASFLGYDPNLTVSSGSELEINQADLKRLYLDTDDFESIIYKDKDFAAKVREYVGDDGSTGTAYLVEAVFYATDIKATLKTSSIVKASTGGAPPNCPETPIDPTVDATASQKLEQKKADNEAVLKANADKALSAIIPVPVKGGYERCKTLNNLSELKSRTPVVIGAKLQRVWFPADLGNKAPSQSSTGLEYDASTYNFQRSR